MSFLVSTLFLLSSHRREMVRSGIQVWKVLFKDPKELTTSDGLWEIFPLLLDFGVRPPSVNHFRLRFNIASVTADTLGGGF